MSREMGGFIGVFYPFFVCINAFCFIIYALICVCSLELMIVV